MAGWILRVFKGRGRQLLVPRAQVQIFSLETVQKNYTSKILFEERSPNYSDRLSELKLYSLERRRERYSILYTWKVLHNLYPNPGITIARLFPNLHEALIDPRISIDNTSERRGTKISYNPHPEEDPTFTNNSVLVRVASYTTHCPLH